MHNKQPFLTVLQFSMQDWYEVPAVNSFGKGRISNTFVIINLKKKEYKQMAHYTKHLSKHSILTLNEMQAQLILHLV